MRTALQYNTVQRTVNLPVISDWRYLDTLKLGIQFLPDNTIPSGATISLPLKRQGTYSADTAIVLIDGFALNPQTGYWETEVVLESTDLDTLFEPNPDSVTLYSNLLVLDGTDHWFQGPTQTFTIQNQYGRGGET